MLSTNSNKSTSSSNDQRQQQQCPEWLSRLWDKNGFDLPVPPEILNALARASKNNLPHSYLTSTGFFSLNASDINALQDVSQRSVQRLGLILRRRPSPPAAGRVRFRPPSSSKTNNDSTQPQKCPDWKVLEDNSPDNHSVFAITAADDEEDSNVRVVLQNPIGKGQFCFAYKVESDCLQSKKNSPALQELHQFCPFVAKFYPDPQGAEFERIVYNRIFKAGITSGTTKMLPHHLQPNNKHFIFITPFCQKFLSKQEVQLLQSSRTTKSANDDETIEIPKEAEGRIITKNHIQQLTAALKALHSAGIVHGDIMTDNILMFGDQNVALINDWSHATFGDDYGTEKKDFARKKFDDVLALQIAIRKLYGEDAANAELVRINY